MKLPLKTLLGQSCLAGAAGCAGLLLASLLSAPAMAAQDGDIASLQFSDFFRQPAGPAGLELSAALRRADGQLVRMSGYMVQQETPHPGHFMLTPRPVQMSEHADGDADDLPPAWVMVYLPQGQGDALVPHVPGRIEVSGRLSVGRHEADDGRVSWVRLQLQPGATRSLDAREWQALTQHAHQMHPMHD